MWLDNLGKLATAKKSVIEVLRIEPWVSYWWMSLIYERCNFEKSPHINDVIKYIALADFFVGRDLRSITLVSRNNALQEVISFFCKRHHIDFKKQTPLSARGAKILRIKTYFYRLPERVKAILCSAVICGLGCSSGAQDLRPYNHQQEKSHSLII